MIEKILEKGNLNPSQKLVKIYWPVCESIKPKTSFKWRFDDVITFHQKVRKLHH